MLAEIVVDRYAAAGQSQSDYGALASVALDIPMGIGTGLVLDARYAFGLKDQANGSDVVTVRNLAGFVGLRFGFSK